VPIRSFCETVEPPVSAPRRLPKPEVKSPEVELFVVEDCAEGFNPESKDDDEPQELKRVVAPRSATKRMFFFIMRELFSNWCL
jgi:hypothetical protein